MYQMLTILSIAFFLMTGCGSGGGSSGSTENNTNISSNFAYKTQGSVKVSILIPNKTLYSQKQILIYESKKTINGVDIPGELTIFDRLLVEGVNDVDGKYEISLTIGNHINSIWVVVPTLEYEKQHKIINGQIILTINNEIK